MVQTWLRLAPDYTALAGYPRQLHGMKALISSGATVFAVSLVYASLSAQTAPAPGRTVGAGQGATSAVAQHQGLLTRSCVTCHNQRLQTGGLALDPAALATPAANIETWEKVTRKLRPV